MNPEKLGRKLCFFLRHKPEALGLTLDPMGFADVNKIITNLAEQGTLITLDDIKLCVEEDAKNRFQFLEDRMLIRCVQGHSFPVSTSSYNPFKPTTKLYHGTSEGFLADIMEEGLTPQSRMLVHLTDNLETAREVGNRHAKHGKCVVLEIDAVGMVKRGIDFYIAFNGVILTEFVEPIYIKRLIDD